MSAVTVIVVRDPDGPVHLRVFDDDVEIDHEEVVIDAGAGHTWQSWKYGRDDDLRAAAEVGPNLLAAVAAAYVDPPGGGYVEDKPDDEPWLVDLPGEVHPPLRLR